MHEGSDEHENEPPPDPGVPDTAEGDPERDPPDPGESVTSGGARDPGVPDTAEEPPADAETRDGEA